jgi:hypothetical protein
VTVLKTAGNSAFQVCSLAVHGSHFQNTASNCLRTSSGA